MWSSKERERRRVKGVGEEGPKPNCQESPFKKTDKEREQDRGEARRVQQEEEEGGEKE